MLRVLRRLLGALVETLFVRLRHGPAHPSWGIGFESFVRFLRRDLRALAAWPLPRVRDELGRRAYPRKNRARVACETTTIAGVETVVFTPPRIERARTLLYFHGGSYVYGSAHGTHAEFIAGLALSTQAKVIAVEYRLAPEHPYPAALEDGLAVIGALAQNGCPAANLVLAGDSAGGSLALLLQLALRDRGEAQAHAAVLLSPWLDLAARSASCRSNEATDYMFGSVVERYARDFAGAIELDDARLSPLYARLEALAPLYIQVGAAERLLDEAREFTARARAASVQIELDVVPDLPHAPASLAALHAQARGALQRIEQTLNAQLG